MNTVYRRYDKLLQNVQTQEEYSAITNQLLEEIIKAFPELTPKGRVEVRGHIEEEWQAIFQDIHARKGRPIPGETVMAMLLQTFEGTTAIVFNIDRLLRFCEYYRIPSTYFFIDSIIHELIHHIESPGGPGDRPILAEEHRVIRKAFELTDKFLDTHTDTTLIQMLVEGQPKDWFE